MSNIGILKATIDSVILVAEVREGLYSLFLRLL
jgi:hypothetical protein